MTRSGENGNRHRRSGITATSVLVTIGAGVVTWGLARLAAHDWPVAASAGPASLDEVVSAGLAWAATVLAGWLTLTCLIALLCAAPGAVGATAARLARWLTPRVARRALSLALGASVGTVALPAPAAIAVAVSASTGDDAASEHAAEHAGEHAGSAPTPGFRASPPDPAASQAQPVGAVGEFAALSAIEIPAPDTTAPDAPAPPPATGVSASGASAPAPGWLPDRPAPVSRSDHPGLLGGRLRPTATAIDTVTVQRGDTLWSIVADHLGPGATDAEIAAEWPRWFEANRAVIGSNPDVILPGQQLRAPIAEVTR